MNRRTFVIAEAGVNHNGDPVLAKKMVDAVFKNSPYSIKFQTFKADRLVTRFAEKASYQKNDDDDLQYEMLKKLELKYPDFEDLNKYCKEQDVMFLSSAFYIESINLLSSLNMPIFKIPSGEITNLPYLRQIGVLGKQVILSTGMSDLGEIGDALEVLVRSGTPIDNITVLQCNTEYPTPFEDVNLRAMLTIRNEFDIKVGYSDHTLGIEIPIAAVALGAAVIEKHFTLDRSMAGPDHKASLEPNELKAMVKAIRNVENAMGDGIKKPSHSESKNINVVRKSIVASRTITKGKLFTEDNLTVKRPGIGMSPMRWNDVIGKKAIKDFTADEIIKI